MTFPTNSLLISWGGQAWTTETWTNRVRARSTVPVTDEALVVGIAGMAEVLQAVLAPLFHGSGAFTWTACHLDWVKVAALDTTGHYALGSDADYFTAGPGLGASGSAGNAVPQVATCVTLRTVAHRGHASRGRIFLPGGDVTGLPVTGEMTVASAESIRDVARDMLNHVNTAVRASFSSQMSVAVGSDIGAGLFHDVTAVTVGRVMDTQRRRRRSLAEQYVADAALA